MAFTVITGIITVITGIIMVTIIAKVTFLYPFCLTSREDLFVLRSAMRGVSI